MTEKQLAHIVYFTLHDRSPERVEQLLAACRYSLTGHDGTVHYSVGTLVQDLDLTEADGGIARRALHDSTCLRDWMREGLDLVDLLPR